RRRSESLLVRAVHGQGRQPVERDGGDSVGTVVPKCDIAQRRKTIGGQQVILVAKAALATVGIGDAGQVAAVAVHGNGHGGGAGRIRGVEVTLIVVGKRRGAAIGFFDGAKNPVVIVEAPP